LLLIPFLGTSQGTFTAPVGYNTGAPTAAPSGVGTRWRFDLLTGKKYTWNPDAVAWDEDPRGIDQISGCSAPLYTPGYNQSTFAVNSCSTPELYQYYSSAWHCLNCDSGPTYTAGTGINIAGNVISSTITQANGSETKINVGSGISKTGTGTTGDPYVLTNTAPNVVQTLSIVGQDLSLSNGGGTVTIPADDALGNGFVNGGGNGSMPDGTEAKVREFKLKTDIESGVYNDDEFNAELQWGGYYLPDGTYNPVPGYASFVSGNAATGEFSQFQFNGEEKRIGLQGITGGVETTGLSISGTGISASIGNGASLNIADGRTTKLGIEYLAEYLDILSNDRSVLDVGLAKQLIASENGALGTGFTNGGGNGTIPANTLLDLDTKVFSVENGTIGFNTGEGASLQLNVSDVAITGNVSFEGNNASFLAAQNLTIGGDESITITSSAGEGAKYAADYSAGFSDRSLPDVGAVNILKQTPVSYDNGAAPNNTIFYSTTDSKLSYKDPAGVVHNLY